MININNSNDLIKIINKSNLNDNIKTKINNDLDKANNSQLIIHNLNEYQNIINNNDLIIKIDKNKEKILRNYYFPNYKEGDNIYNYAIKEIKNTNSLLNKKVNGLIELGYKAKNQQDSLLYKIDNESKIVNQNS